MRFSIFFKNKKKGFTLVELMVVIAIASVMMAVVVVQQNSWNDRLITSIQAYEMALMIRQAQIYSLGVKVDEGGNSSDKFSVGYGVYINQNNLAQYTYFADRNGDKIYNAGEEIETKNLNRGVTINRVCGKNNVCFSSTSLPSATANISFLRPDPKANINLLNGGLPFDYPPVAIYFLSPGGREVSVKVEANGQVSVSQ